MVPVHDADGVMSCNTDIQNQLHARNTSHVHEKKQLIMNKLNDSRRQRSFLALLLKTTTEITRFVESTFCFQLRAETATTARKMNTYQGCHRSTTSHP